MKQYNTPEIEVMILADEDILTLSKIDTGGDPLTFDF